MSVISTIRAGAFSAIIALTPALANAQTTYFAPTEELSLAAENLFQEALRRPAPRAGAPVFDPATFDLLADAPFSINFETAAPDASTGAFRLTGLSIIPEDEVPEPLILAEEVLIWGFDSAALNARLQGERLDETIRLFDRIELSGITVDLTDFSNLADSVASEIAGEGRTYYDDSAMQVSRMVLSGLTLHPWTHQARDDEDEGVSAIRIISAFARSFSLDSILYENAVSVQNMDSAEISGTVTSRYPHNLMHGYDRGRIAGAFQSAMDFSVDYQMEELGGLGTFQMNGRSGYGGWEDIDFSALLAWGERGELPPVTERDLISFGRYVLDDFEMDLNGNTLMRLGRAELTADEFAWFLPERISVGYQGMELDLSGFMNFAEAIAEEFPPEEGQPRPQDIARMLDAAGLGKIAGDGMLDIRWNSETGETTLDSRGHTEGLFSGLTRIKATFPSYAQLVPAFGADGLTPDDEAMQELMDNHLAFHSAEYSTTDIGGFDAIARLLIEVARSGYVDEPMIAGFADSDPVGVRMFASGMLNMTSGAITADFPQAKPWIAGLARFIAGGGTFSINLDPPAPVTAATIDAAGGVDALSPEALVSLFGLSMKHTPPAQ